MKQEKYPIEDEIDLMDYLRVILKRKIFILVIFLLAVIITGILSFLWPKTYEIETVLRVGGFEKNFTEDPEALATAIEAGRYEFSVRQALNIAEKDYPVVKAEHPKDTSLVKMKTESVDTETAKRILSEHIELILAKHQQEIEKETIALETRTKELQESLDLLKSQKLYADKGIADLQLTVSSIRSRLSLLEPTEVIKPPTVSESPVKPRPLLNIAVAGILSLFIGVFLAFGREWWERA